ncbi:hypothetical protein IX57_14645 [Paracoccus sanguinis]|nr:hypothetical protein IX57_14645 [Paracoccus sanguinis]
MWSAMAERPRRSMVTMSSALSSSSEDRMRSSSDSLWPAVVAVAGCGDGTVVDRGLPPVSAPQCPGAGMGQR